MQRKYSKDSRALVIGDASLERFCHFEHIEKPLHTENQIERSEIKRKHDVALSLDSLRSTSICVAVETPRYLSLASQQRQDSEGQKRIMREG